MASYQQVIELVVKGQEQLAKLERRVKQLNKEAEKLRTEPARTGTKTLADEIKEAANAQQNLVKEKKNALLNQIKLNSAVDLYGRRLRQVQTTAAADQAQFKGRISEIQAAFKAFKTDGDISGIQAVSTELSRILEYSREIQRNEVGREKSNVRLRGYINQINQLKAAGLDTSKVESLVQKASLSLGTKRFKLAEKLEVQIQERLGKLKQEHAQLKANNREADKRTKNAAKAKAQRGQDLALGAGFPLLFGGGAGQVAGGVIGALGGGGFGGQILGAAIGQQIEDATRRTAELGQALETLDMSALADSTLLVTAKLREAVDASIALGDSQKAVEAVTKETLLQTGLLPGSVKEINSTVTGLSNAWDEVVGAASGLVALLSKDFLNVLTAGLRLVGAIAKGMNTAIGFIRETTKTIILEVVKRIPFIGSALEGVVSKVLNGFGGINEAAEERNFKLIQSRKELEKELDLDNQLLAIEQRRVAGSDAAAKLTNAQAERDKKMLKLKFKTEAEVLELRKKFGPLDTEALESLIRQKALNEEIRIDKKFQLDQERAGQLALKELEKERKKIAKEAQEIRAQETKIAQARIQTQLNELANEQKIFDIRQQTANAELNLQNARYSAESSLLQLQESRMQRRLADLEKLNTNFDEQRKLIDAIARNRVQQAKVERAVAIAQAQQGIRQAEIALQQIKFQVQRINLEIQLQKVKARGEKDEAVRTEMLREINQVEKQNAQLVGVMVEEGVKQVRIAKEIAQEQAKVAENIFRGKVESIEAERVEARRAVNARELAKATGEAADEAGRLNSNMSRGIGSGPRKGETSSTKLKIDSDVYDRVVGEANRKGPGGGFKNIFELTEALDAAQATKNARTERMQRSSASASSYANPSRYSGGSGARFGGGGTGSVNVTTGPVMEFDGNRYVSMSDFEKGLAKVARSQATASRSYGGRNYAGVS